MACQQHYNIGFLKFVSFLLHLTLILVCVSIERALVASNENEVRSFGTAVRMLLTTPASHIWVPEVKLQLNSSFILATVHSGRSQMMTQVLSTCRSGGRAKFQDHGFSLTHPNMQSDFRHGMKGFLPVSPSLCLQLN